VKLLICGCLEIGDEEGCDKIHESDDEELEIATTSAAEMRECLQRLGTGLDHTVFKEIDLFLFN